MRISNPLLPGCYPDPSICRAGNWYYLVTSTFEMWPGLPIFRSRDLANWEQIGHVIDRPAQMTFDGVESSRGLFAPTIRHHNGTFYLVCTRVGAPDAPHHGNFLVTAEDPAGDWSEPRWLRDEHGTPVDGIDPSIFFADDDRIWLHGTRPAPTPEWEGQTEVWLREYDPDRGLVGAEHIIWTGAMRGAVWAEGPHLFERSGRFYLLAAEGGTEFHHAVCIARSEAVTGPYEGSRANPVLTHRHLGHPGHGRGPEVVGVGHADLVEAPDNSWWAVLLGMRTYGGYHYNLGRETFLVPVEWQDGWPVFAPDEGRVPAVVEVPESVQLGQRKPTVPAALDTKAGDTTAGRGGPLIAGTRANAKHSGGPPQEAAGHTLATAPNTVTGGPVLPSDPRWTSLRGPWDGFASVEDERWILRVQPTTLTERTTPTFLGIRQQHRRLDLTAELNLSTLTPGEETGVVVRQSEEHHAYLALLRREDDWLLRAVLHQPGGDTVLGEQPWSEADCVVLGLQAREQDYTFTLDGAAVATADGRQLDTVTTGGFLGLWLGVFATSHGRPTSSSMVLRELVYSPVGTEDVLYPHRR
ncbi:glycoside hydrolase family 43 protein [Nesterenkonia ebinurensis]|uniref:glycoside hydrolase family 43 protein n=1 Tax=Nesterenkonia ebinurensis TaxID=2608252 RepID=UPI00123D7DF0|nr:glycoside hydrolase family 43 protein [Nesterenkonia ebinurensis]